MGERDVSALKYWIQKGVGIGALAIAGAFLLFILNAGDVANRDFISYWAAGRQLVHGANPYDATAVLSIEKEAGWSQAAALIMRNPPGALLLLVAPIGLLEPVFAGAVWSLAIIVSLMLAVRLIWTMEGKQEGRRHLIGYCFGPALACVLAGQTGTFVLLGLALFLFWERSRPLLAGCALSLCAVKPHLFVPFGLVLLLWSVRGRAYRLLAGVAIGAAATSSFALILRPQLFSDYLALLRTAGVEDEFLPVFGSLLRIVIARDATWLQFVPAVVACVWAVWFYRRHRQHWDWSEQGAWIVLVSVCAAPYAWFTDEAILLPALLHGIYKSDRHQGSLLWFGVPAAIALVMVLFGVPMASGYYIWTPWAWLGCYYGLTRNS
ncbi:MAG: glycosyltransferase family 87 protein [Bryobacteraceae bacterium]